ncbi:unnamed protein product [Penicillium manginii]
MPFDISYEEICSKFDRLISNGIIQYQPSHPVLVTDNGMTFCFTVVEALKEKPQAGEAFKSAQSNLGDGTDAQPETFGPGSDLAFDHPDICITRVNETHFLVINKFPVYRPMLLLLTIDSYRRQFELLNAEDIEAAWNLVCGLDVEHFAFFNCTVTAGSSRAHKHLQVIPAPGANDGYADGFRFFPDYDPGPQEGGPSCVYFLQRFEDPPEGQVKTSQQLMETYLRLLQQTREALNIKDGQCPHNWILTKRWMMIIPRRNRDYKGLSGNAPGMIGSVYVSNQSEFDAWKEAGPQRVLAGLGLPRVDSES